MPSIAASGPGCLLLRQAVSYTPAVSLLLPSSTLAMSRPAQWQRRPLAASGGGGDGHIGQNELVTQHLSRLTWCVTLCVKSYSAMMLRGAS